MMKDKKMYVSSELRRRMESVADRNEKSVKRIPFISGFVEDIIFIFESILLAVEELERRIEKLEELEKGDVEST